MSAERDPETIQEDIRQTRDALGDTVAALGYKTDLKGRAEGRIAETTERISGTAGDAAALVQEAMPDSARDGADRAREVVRRRPDRDRGGGVRRHGRDRRGLVAAALTPAAVSPIAAPSGASLEPRDLARRCDGP